MADNTLLSANVGSGDTLRTEDRTTYKTPVSLIDVGGTSAEALIGDSGVAMPVKGLGTAGTAAAGVVTVQGIASMTALQVADNSGSLTVDAPVGTPVFVRLSDGSSAITTLPVSVATVPSHDVTNAGTFAVQAAQSGTWHITNVSGTVSLPTGAATAAKQPALGTAGTASSDVITVQGIASMTALKVDGSAVTQPVSIASTVTVTGAGGSFPVTDSGGSLTVDAPVGTPVFVRLSDGSSAITTLPVSLASVPSHAVTNAGTFAVQATLAAGSTNIAKAEDVASADADVGVPAMAVRKATPANTSGTDGDYEMLQMSAGRLWASVVVDTALPAGTNAIGKLASNTGVTIGAVEIAAAQTLATVTTVSTVTTCSTVTTLTGGGVAHDSADSGNPVKVGAKAKATLSTNTLVSADDRTDATSDLDGAIIVNRGACKGDYVSANASNTDGTSTQCIAAQSSGIKTYLTDITLTNTSSTNTYCEIKDGSTVKWTFPVPANGGVTHRFETPLAGTAATAWNFDPGTAVTTMYCSMSGFKSKV